ncbi:MAG: hypothetical protein AB7G23_14615 [Vicinamibacterales bacterium]
MDDIVRAFATWVETTSLSSFATGQRWVWPAAETLHFLGMALLAGTVGAWDLRLLGLVRAVPPGALRRLLPWGVAGFLLNVATGVVFFAGAPYQYLYNWAFHFKLLCIGLAGLNMAAYYVSGLDAAVRTALPGERLHPRARLAGGLSLLLWIAVMYWGRMLTFFRPPFVVPPA